MIQHVLTACMLANPFRCFSWQMERPKNTWISRTKPCWLGATIRPLESMVGVARALLKLSDLAKKDIAGWMPPGTLERPPTCSLSRAGDSATNIAWTSTHWRTSFRYILYWLSFPKEPAHIWEISCHAGGETRFGSSQALQRNGQGFAIFRRQGVVRRPQGLHFEARILRRSENSDNGPHFNRRPEAKRRARGIFLWNQGERLSRNLSDLFHYRKKSSLKYSKGKQKCLCIFANMIEYVIRKP